MSRFERRVKALELKRRGPKPVVFVYLRATTLEHEFHDDRAYFQDLAESQFLRNDFDLVLFPGNDNRPEHKLELVEDVAKLFANIAKNSTRAGFKTEVQEKGEQ